MLSIGRKRRANLTILQKAAFEFTRKVHITQIVHANAGIIRRDEQLVVMNG